MTLNKNKEIPSKIQWKALLDQQILPLSLRKKRKLLHQVLIYKHLQLKQIPKRKLCNQSSKIEDTGTKQVYASEDQNVGLTEAQNIEYTNERAVLDSIDGQIEDYGSTLENNDQDPAMQDEQMSKVSPDNNYCTAIDDDDLDGTIQFGNPVTQPFFVKKHQNTHYRGRLLKFYTNV